MNEIYNERDREAIKKLDAFLPDKIFDAHMHVSNFPFGGMEYFGIEEYYRDMSPLFSGRSIRCNAIPAPTMELKDKSLNSKNVDFIKNQLDLYPYSVGEIMVFPWDSPEDIEKRIVHDRIKGLKCYYFYANGENVRNASINEYLPESALEVANRRKMAITIHLVKDRALAAPENLNQIKWIAERYPDLTLILAHSARAFAVWTAIETVSELCKYENVWYDFSAICESPSIMYILKTIGAKRCMWGSDYNVSMIRGKAVSITDSFCWINGNHLDTIFGADKVNTWSVGIENLMAMRQTAQILDLTSKDVEDIFYNNAARLFG